jgi:hypothetical protein
MNPKDIPAYPFQCQGPTTAPEIYYGMTLRDYFAAKAMPIAATFYDTSDEVCNEAAAWCYKMADAMLEARK